jgi:hypothetical protein
MSARLKTKCSPLAVAHPARTDEAFKRSAGQKIAWRILNGESPADIPIVTALNGQSMPDLQAAKRYGLAVPEAVQAETDIVKGE